MKYRDKDHPVPGHWQIGEYEFQRCPYVYLDPGDEMFIQAYTMYKNGILPRSGGFLDQGNRFIEVMSYMEAIISAHKQEEREKNGK